jgi:hypothetical protein
MGQSAVSVGIRSISQPPSYGARGHTQEIIDLLGLPSDSSAGTGNSLTGANRDNMMQPPPLITGSSLQVGGNKNGNQFWTSTNAASQGAFASASISTFGSSISGSGNKEIRDADIKSIADRGAVALALASPRRHISANGKK